MVKPLGQILIFGKLLKDEKGTLATIETEHLLHHGATIINSSDNRSMISGVPKTSGLSGLFKRFSINLIVNVFCSPFS